MYLLAAHLFQPVSNISLILLLNYFWNRIAIITLLLVLLAYSLVIVIQIIFVIVITTHCVSSCRRIYLGRCYNADVDGHQNGLWSTHFKLGPNLVWDVGVVRELTLSLQDKVECYQPERRSATDPSPSTHHVSGTVYRHQLATQRYQLLS